MSRCIGFGEHEDVCENEAGATHSPIWCQRCDTLRLAHLNERFAAMSRLMGIETQPPDADEAELVRRATECS